VLGGNAQRFWNLETINVRTMHDATTGT
jgi:hypothetical protein